MVNAATVATAFFGSSVIAAIISGYMTAGRELRNKCHSLRLELYPKVLACIQKFSVIHGNRGKEPTDFSVEDRLLMVNLQDQMNLIASRESAESFKSYCDMNRKLLSFDLAHERVPNELHDSAIMRERDRLISCLRRDIGSIVDGFLKQ